MFYTTVLILELIHYPLDLSSIHFLVLKADWLRGVWYSSDNRTPIVSLFVSHRLLYFSHILGKNILV